MRNISYINMIFNIKRSLDILSVLEIIVSHISEIKILFKCIIGPFVIIFSESYCDTGIIRRNFRERLARDLGCD